MLTRFIEGTSLEVDLHTPAVRQAGEDLEKAELLTRTYANDNAAVAARLLWHHLTTLAPPHLNKWASTTIGELVTLVARGGERFADGELHE